MSEKSRYYPDEFNWWELPEACRRCRQPLHMKSGQDFSFCPSCVIDNRNAKNGRDALTVAMARLRLEEARAAELRRLQDDDDEDDGPCGCFIAGMPL